MSERDLIADALPGYEIGVELGRGGWGVVYGARHRNLGREVAIKQLPRAFASDPQVRQRFAHEARLAASLEHPHIVPVYDFVDRDDGMCLIVMERCNGSVSDRFRTHGIATDEACASMLSLCAALTHAHTRNVLHRDIKPENLLYGDHDTVKLADFGIARALDASIRFTATGMTVGTPAYMSPEQASGENLTPASDIYSAGVMFYELLSGELPFGELASIGALIKAHLTEPPRPMAEIAPHVPIRIAEVVERAVAKSPADRYASAEDLGIAIAEAGAHAFGPGWLRQRRFPLLGAPAIVAASERNAGGAGRAGTVIIKGHDHQVDEPVVGDAPTSHPTDPALPVTGSVAPGATLPPSAIAPSPGAGLEGAGAPGAVFPSVGSSTDATIPHTDAPSPGVPPPPGATAPPPMPPAAGDPSSWTPPAGPPLAPGPDPAPHGATLDGAPGVAERRRDDGLVPWLVGGAVVVVAGLLAIVFLALGGGDDDNEATSTSTSDEASEASEAGNSDDADEVAADGSTADDPGASTDDGGETTDGAAGDADGDADPTDTDAGAPPAGGDASGDGLVIGAILSDSEFDADDAVAIDLALADLEAAGGVLGGAVTALTPGFGGRDAARLVAEGATVIVGPGDALEGPDAVAAAAGGAVVISNSDFFDREIGAAELYFRTRPAIAHAIHGAADALAGASSAVIAQGQLAIGRDGATADELAALLEAAGISTTVLPEGATPDEVAAAAAGLDAVVFLGVIDPGDHYRALFAAGITADTTQFLSVGNNGWSGGFDDGELVGIRGLDLDFGTGDALEVRLPATELSAAAAQAYDAVIVAALAAEAAGSTDPAAIAAALPEVTAGGEVCTDVAACLELIRAGSDIDYDGPSGPLELSPADGRPDAALVRSTTLGENILDGTTDIIVVRRN